ncbi:MAG: YggS family pyridoxal phosphate-dependent enzyme [Pseudomonadota bacterium]
MIAKQLEQTRADITRLELEHQRNPGSVELLAVSKKKPLSNIRQAIAAGQLAFGENYAEEGVNKIITLNDASVSWHYIGHIQSNKTRLIAAHYQWVQSVDRAKIIERLTAHRPAELPALQICLQVNVDAQDTKSGCSPAELPELARLAAAAPNLVLRGIMAIPAPPTSVAEQRNVFADLKNLFDTLKSQHNTVDTLSMGMSADIEAAIAEGSTMVRVGTAIFGRRD